MAGRDSPEQQSHWSTDTMCDMAPEMDPIMTLYLWDLRTQAEAQLRGLTALQQLIDAHPHVAHLTVEQRKTKILAEFVDLLMLNASIRELLDVALSEADTLGAGADEPA